MTARNDITGDSLISKANSNAYRDNWDNIFGKTKRKNEAINLLVAEVTRIVTESGNIVGFDPTSWVDEWFESPNNSLGGQTPEEYFNKHGVDYLVQIINSTESTALV